MGLSGAVVEVHDHVTIKRGPGVRQQADYADVLNVGPNILEVLDDGYVMETCDYDNALRCPLVTLRRVLEKLTLNVWNRAAAPTDWRTPFIEWAYRQPYDPLPLMNELYPPFSVGPDYVMIHGDPTLSNVVYSRNGRVLLIDPIKPTGKIPSIREVDIGKMLQSVVGWEHVMFGWPEPMVYIAAGFIKDMSDEELLRAMFWLGVHALRIIPYADNNPRAMEWSLMTARTIFREIERNAPCVTLTILMERSLTLAKQY